MKRLMAFCLALMLVVCAIPMPQADAATNMTATVKGGWLRLREQPNTNAKTIASYYTGTKVTILGTSGSWYYVQVGNHKGYMLGSYLNVNADSGSSNAPSGNLNITAWIISGDGGNVRLRSGPGTTYGVLASYPIGTKVTILAKGTNWFQISVNGKVGYMMSQYLTTTTPGTSGNIGDDWLNSGSGLTAWIYAKNGGNCNLRSGAGKEYAVIGNYSVGTQVTILSYGYTWCRVQVGTRTGYIMTDLLTTTNPNGSSSTPSNPPSTSGGYTAYVTSTNGGGVNMRSGAGKSFRVLVQLPVGTQVTVLQHNTTWDYIRYGTTDGYMDNSFLTTIPPSGSTTTPPATGYYATVNVSTNTSPVRMRKGPGTNYNVIASVPQGTRVQVLSESGGWCYINYNGTTGYMMKTYLIADTSAIEIKTVALNTYTAHPGTTLSATITPAGATVNYAWIDKSGNVIATTATYTIKNEDVGKEIALRVVGTGSYTGTVTSQYATVTIAEKTTLTGVTITTSGSILAPKPGDKLTARATPENATASYRWYRGNGIQVGASSEYTVTEADIGTTIYCLATGMGSYAGEAKAETGIVVSGIATPTDLGQ